MLINEILIFYRIWKFVIYRSPQFDPTLTQVNSLLNFTSYCLYICPAVLRVSLHNSVIGPTVGCICHSVMCLILWPRS